MKDFSALKYYSIDYSQRVTSKLTKFNDGRTFTIKTTGGQEYEYLIYARADFELNGKKEFLNVYISKRSAESGRKKGALFIPFYDETSGDETYGGGRYLVLDLPENDELVLDFNMAYNPYCVYNPDHSCPIPPRENHLDFKPEICNRISIRPLTHFKSVALLCLCSHHSGAMLSNPNCLIYCDLKPHHEPYRIIRV
ncbi:MAG: DUF1684 domain-containing protein [Cyclobacteriaceae bacterium]|nr:DUF1684 domain-containing protein [Cyclobacteriaceae bacterium]